MGHTPIHRAVLRDVPPRREKPVKDEVTRDRIENIIDRVEHIRREAEALALETTPLPFFKDDMRQTADRLQQTRVMAENVLARYVAD